MKKLFKTSLTSLIIALVASLTVSVYAYSGTMDANDNIKINNSISNGTGTVQITQDVANGYKLYYQWVETDANSFKEIQKINEEIKIISYYNIYQSYAAQGINNAEYGQKYEDAQRAYQAKYGSILGSEAFTTSYYAELKARKINLLPNYDDTKWTETTDNTFKMDLSTFSGTKDYTAWIKLVTTSGTTAYDAEIFQLTGTKQASTGDNTNTGDNNNNNSGNTNTDKNNNNNSGNTNTDNNNNNNNSGNTNTDKNNNNNNSGNTNTDKNNNNNSGNTNTDKNNNNNSGNTNTDKNNITSNTNKDDGKDEPTTTTKNDQTTSNTKLPQTGVSYGVVIAMLAVAGYGVAQFVKYKRIK